MQNVLQRIGEFVAHEWRFFLLIIPITAAGAYLQAFVLTPVRIMGWLVRLWPLSARLHLEMGRMLAESDPQKAEAEMRQAIQLNPQMGEAYFLLADLLTDQPDRLDDAEQAVKEMLRQYPGHPAAYCLQGIIRRKRRDFTGAERSFRAANAAAPEFAWPCTLLGELLRDDLHNTLGAEIAYRQAIRNQPKTASNYFHLGNLMMRAGRHSEAVQCYEMSSQKSRGDAPSLVNLGLALVASGRPKDAEKLLPRIRRIREKSAPAEVGLGRLFYKLRRRGEAEAALRRAIARDSTMVEAYVELGRLLDEDPYTMAEAEQVYRRGLQVDCTHDDLNYDLALLLRRMHRHGEALPFLQQALAADDEDFETHVGLAAVFKRCGDTQQFTQSIEKARLLAPCDDPYAAACLEAVSDHADLAFEHLGKAVEAGGFPRWWAWNDPDLEGLRSDPRFVQIVGPCPESAIAQPEKAG